MIFIIFVGVLGLVIGSFITVVTHRLPLMLETTDSACAPRQQQYNLAMPSSHCPHCKKPLKIYHNIPLLSFILLRGKCAFCGKRISWQYPLIELLACLTAIIIALKFGFSLQTGAALILTWSLLALIIIDIKHLYLPDCITMPVLWIGLLFSVWNISTTSSDAIIGAIAGYVFLWIVAWLFKKIRGIEGMGYGDFKLLAMLGAWLGWQQLPFVIFASSFAGAIVGLSLIAFKKHKFNKPMPFGPYLATAGWIALLWGNTIANWYLNVFYR